MARGRPTSRSAAVLLSTLLAIVSVRPAAAQDSAPPKRDSAVTPTPPQPAPAQPPPNAPAQQQPAPRAVVDFSGVIFGNYQYHTEAGARSTNRFDVDRAYLTFRMPAGERASIRATADVFKNTTQGYSFRAKYAYLQYDYLKSGTATLAFARLGILNTVEIEHEENFWPRWISPVATDRLRFFSSADVGAATQVNLPGKWGELYGTITNGPGYVNAGSDDRFKDYALRLSLTPFAASGGGPTLLRTFTVSPWVYKGDTASRFVAGGTGQIGPVGSGLKRDRWGVLVGVRDPRLVLAGGYAERSDESESGANTAASPVSVASLTGRMLSAYTVFKPFLLADSARGIPLGVVFRYDEQRPVKSQDASQRFVIAGLTYDVTRRAAFALDYQEQLPRNGLVGAASKIYYAHFVANF